MINSIGHMMCNTPVLLGIKQNNKQTKTGGGHHLMFLSVCSRTSLALVVQLQCGWLTSDLDSLVVLILMC